MGAEKTRKTEEEKARKGRKGECFSKTHVQKEKQKGKVPIARWLGATSHEAAFRGKKAEKRQRTVSHRPMIIKRPFDDRCWSVMMAPER
jgi:hypothetical protein